MIRKALCFLTVLFLFVAPALGQKPYTAPAYPTKERSALIEWGIGAAFMVGCLVVAFKPSKRSNLK